MSEFDFDFSREAAATDSELAKEIARLSPMTEAEVNALLPDRTDKEKLKKLVDLVNSAATRNDKLAALSGNMQQVGGVVLTLLTKILKAT